MVLFGISSEINERINPIYIWAQRIGRCAIFVLLSCIVVVVVVAAVVYFTLNYAKKTSIKKRVEKETYIIYVSIALGVAKYALKFNELAIK